MKVLDTNVFIRFITEPQTEHDVLFNRLARSIFEDAQQQENIFSISEAVVAEILFVLTTKNGYGLPRRDAYVALRSLIALTGCSMEHRSRIEAALEVWITTPKISIVDALCLAKAQEEGADLVTFDTALAKAAEIERWDRRPDATQAMEHS